MNIAGTLQVVRHRDSIPCRWQRITSTFADVSLLETMLTLELLSGFDRSLQQ